MEIAALDELKKMEMIYQRKVEVYTMLLRETRDLISEVNAQEKAA